MATASTALKILRTDLLPPIRRGVVRAGRWFSKPAITLKRDVPAARLSPSVAAGREIPKMIDVAELPFRAMIGVFPDMSLLKGRDIAQELNKNDPSGKFRVPTLSELRQLNKCLAAKLLGCNFLIWTETEDLANKGLFLLCRRAEGYAAEGSYYYDLSSFSPDRKYPLFAIRLIEDK